MGLKNLEVQMYDSTLEKVMEIKDLANVSSGSDAIKISVDVAREIADVIAKGGRVIIEEKDKSRSELKVKSFKKECA